MEKLGLGYDVLSEINPRLIFAAISGMSLFSESALDISNDPQDTGPMVLTHIEPAMI